MQTNHKNLDWFEAVTVCMILAGVILLGALIFGSLSAQKQKQASSAMNIFDFHEQIPSQVALIRFIVWDGPQNYMDQFYLAFEQTMSLGQNEIEDWTRVRRQTKLAYDSASNMLSGLRLQSTSQVAHQGRVLGISLEDSLNIDGSLKAEVEIPYSFVSPKRILLFNVISP